MNNKSSQSGFTLIELVVVITILGILAAVALPRFSNLQVEARKAKLQGAIGAVKAAAGLFHAQCLAELSRNDASTTCATLTMEGETVKGVHRYPQAHADGIILASGLDINASKGDYRATAGDSGEDKPITISVPSPADKCKFTYTSPSALNKAPTVVIASGDDACD